LWSSSARCSSFWRSPSSSRVTGIPVVNLFLDQRIGLPVAIHAAFQRAELPLQLGEPSVPQLGDAIEIVLPFGLFDLHLRLFDLRAEIVQPFHLLLLGEPTALERIGLLPKLGELVLDPVEPLFARRVLLLAQRFALDLELHDPS
jgi:hypothetical protein